MTDNEEIQIDEEHDTFTYQGEEFPLEIMKAYDELHRLELTIDQKQTEHLLAQKQATLNVLQLLKVFANQGHSGFSAPYILDLFRDCALFRPLTPLTGEDDEWVAIDEDDNPDHPEENIRDYGVFRKNHDNKTAYYIDGIYFKEPGGGYFSCKESAIPVTFPCNAKDLKPRYFALDHNIEFDENSPYSIKNQIKNGTYTEEGTVERPVLIPVDIVKED